MFTSQVAIVVCFKAFVCLSASFGRRYKGFECAFKGFERRFWDALSCYEFLAVLNVEASGQTNHLKTLVHRMLVMRPEADVSAFTDEMAVTISEAFQVMKS